MKKRRNDDLCNFVSQSSSVGENLPELQGVLSHKKFVEGGGRDKKMEETNNSMPKDLVFGMDISK